MSGFIESGRAVDLVLVVLLVEAAWLVLARRRPAPDVALALLPGAMMLLALRAALTGAGWWWVAAALAASFPIHLADLRRRNLW